MERASDLGEIERIKSALDQRLMSICLATSNTKEDSLSHCGVQCLRSRWIAISFQRKDQSVPDAVVAGSLPPVCTDFKRAASMP